MITCGTLNYRIDYAGGVGTGGGGKHMLPSIGGDESDEEEGESRGTQFGVAWLLSMLLLTVVLGWFLESNHVSLQRHSLAPGITGT